MKRAPGPSANRLGQVSVRIPPANIAIIDDLKPLYPAANGTETRRSDVLRAMLDLAMPVVGNAGLVRQLQAQARAQGVPAGALLLSFVRDALDAANRGEGGS